jgi:hypothetical protein
MTIKDSLKAQFRKLNLICLICLFLLVITDNSGVSWINWLNTICFLVFFTTLFYGYTSIKCPQCNKSIYYSTLTNKVFPYKMVYDKCLNCGCNYLENNKS